MCLPLAPVPSPSRALLLCFPATFAFRQPLNGRRDAKCLAAATGAGQASPAQSCWSGDLASCGGLPDTAATSSSVSFSVLLKNADGSACTQTCAQGTAVTATLDGVAGTEVANTCGQGACTFEWSAPTTEQSGTLDLVAIVQGTAVSATVNFLPGECPHADECEMLPSYGRGLFQLGFCLQMD